LTLLSPILISYKAGLIGNQRAKEILLTHFLKGMNVQAFNEACSRFCTDKLPALIRRKAADQIQHYLESSIEVVVVSASPENWVEPWCRSMGLKCIASILEVRDQQLTGRLKGFNCYGDEKVKRIRSCYDLSFYDQVYAFGDTRGDLPMLELATEKHYQPFR
ncbi:MAG: HAD family hydrolase, partial [Flavisolibacter sp.]